jgi:antitoxin (DNA-binding transcriptional repressor) of toxin-antitoxin stability system
MEAKLFVYEAKTHFSSYFHRASLGESFVVTSRVKPMALIVPMDAQVKGDPREAQIRAAIERIKARRADPKWPKISSEEIRAWTHEGHRW